MSQGAQFGRVPVAGSVSGRAGAETQETEVREEDIMRNLLGAAAASIAILAASGANAQDDFYAGNSIEVIVPASAGGSYGSYAILVAEELGRFIPGEPTVVPNFMEGAGGMRASNYVGNVAATDGTVLYLMHQNAPTSQLLSPDAAQYDAGAFEPIGVISAMNSVMVVRNDTEVDEIADAMNGEVILGSTGRGSYQFIVPTLLNDFMGTQFNVVTTYGGTGETFLAMERGEIAGLMTSIITITEQQPTWLDGTGTARTILQVGASPASAIPDVPLLTALAQDDDQRAVYQFLSASNGFARSLVAPAGTPADRVEILRAAFAAMLADEGVQARAAELGLPLDSSDAATLGAAIDDVLATDPAVIQLTESIMSE